MDKNEMLAELAELHAMVLAIQAARPKAFPLSGLELAAAVFVNRHHAEIEAMARDAGYWRTLKNDARKNHARLLARLGRLDTPAWDAAMSKHSAEVSDAT